MWERQRFHSHDPGGDASDRVQGAGAGGHLPQDRLSSRLQQHGLPHHRHTHRGQLVILRLNALNLFSSFLFCLSVSLRRYALTIAWKCFQVQLEDQVCDECKEGRTKLRPGLVLSHIPIPYMKKIVMGLSQEEPKDRDTDRTHDQEPRAITLKLPE